MRTLAFRSLCLSLFLSFAGSGSQAAPYLESGGRVVVEAEHFEKRTTEVGGEHRYVIVPDEDPGTSGPFDNARGGKYIQNIPEAGQNKNANASVVGVEPYVEYLVQISTPGEYQLYMRCLGYDGGADSLYVKIMEIPSPGWYRYSPDPTGTDFALLRNDNADANNVTGWNGYAGPELNSGDGGEVPAVWNITKAGTYTIRISQREDSMAIDAFILQLSSMAAPTSPGPAESAIAGTFVRISQQPTNANVALGGTATFSVVADGSAALNIKWQKAAPGTTNFTDVAGATSLSYTTPAATLADEGTKYRVIISVADKSVTSNDVTLSVDTKPAAIARVSGSGSFSEATVVFTEAVTADTAGNKANYSADGGLTISDVKVINPTTVRLTTSKQTSGTKYTVTAKNLKDLVGNAPVDSKATFTGFVASRGVLAFQAYFNIPGNPVENLVNDPKFPNSPDDTGYVTAFDSRTIYPTDAHESYGGRISGWLVPAETAQYELFLRSDDASQLFLSTDDNSANAAIVAEETGCCGAFEESGAPETSAPISLTAGKRYFIQALYKEGGGGDYVQVAWRKVGDTAAASSLQPIPGKFLEAFASPDVTLNITQQPASASVAAGTPVTFSVRYDALSFLGKTASVQWQKNGVDIAGATSQDYTIPFANPADNGAKIRAVVSVGSLASVNSADATLNVTSDTTAPALAGANGSAKSVRLKFSEPLDATSAANKANYTLDKGATVSAAKVVSAADAAAVVELDVAGANPGTVYTVTVNNVQDRSKNAIAANSKLSYVAYNAFYDFDDGSLPAGTTVYGSAAILAGRGVNGGTALMLTPPAGSQQGGFLIPDLASGAAVNKFTVSFKLFIGEGSGNAADGFSFSFAPDVPEASVGEEGAGTGITLALDTYDNGGAEAPAVDVKYAGTEVETKKVSKAILVNNKYVDVLIRLNAGGTLDVIHNATNYYSKLAIPGFAPITGGRILIGARTGGEWERALVDDFAIMLNADVPDLPKPTESPKFAPVVLQGGKIVLAWAGTATLQSSDSITGPWTDVAGAASPFSVTVGPGQRFYRLK